MAWLASAVLWGLVDQITGAIAPKLDGGGRVAQFFARRWSQSPNRQLDTEFVRSLIFAGLFAITMLPIALPLLVDADGFGGFPHRVNDEVGPGWGGLWKWYKTGALLDFMPKIDGKEQTRLDVLTWAVPVVFVFARGRFHRWLWAPVVLYVVFLGKGPDPGERPAVRRDSQAVCPRRVPGRGEGHRPAAGAGGRRGTVPDRPGTHEGSAGQGAGRGPSFNS
jgi:hypothetical protein